jgi:chorismate dehydratase
MQPTRLAAVRYLNTAPLVEGLEKLSGVTLVPTVPARIAEMVTSGAADLGLCSVVDVASPQHDLSFVPVGQIGCDGPTLTVRLYSRVALEQVTTLCADTDSHTSVILARLLLAERFGASPCVVAFDARERVSVGTRHTTDADGWPESLLLIGDKVVTDAPPPERYPFQLDLGEAWKAWTGLPFVYAMWACRRDRLADPAIALAAAVLDRQRRHNLQRLEWLVATRAPAARWPLELARHYVGGLLRYEVGPRERAGVERFIHEALRAKLLEPHELSWCPPPAPGAVVATV